MRNRYFITIVSIAVVCIMLLAGCGAGENGSQGSSAGSGGSGANTEAADLEEHSLDVFAMDTVMNLTTYGGSDQLLKDAEAAIRELENLYSVTYETSEIYAVNKNGSGTLSDKTSELMSFALDICRKTEGALDISIYPAVREWGFTTGEYKVPDEAVLRDILKNVDYSRIQMSDDGTSVQLAENMKIDLGSVAKGYTGDLVTEMFREAGVKSALINLGGNVQTLGKKTNGNDWKIAVQDPYGGEYLGIVEVSDKAVITSGGYERYFEDEEGNLYWHIIDPATGRPADSGLVSVTIVGEKGVYCDALSTSLFIMGRDKAVDFWREYQDFDMILVDEDGTVTVTEGISDSFELADERAYELEVVKK